MRVADDAWVAWPGDLVRAARYCGGLGVHGGDAGDCARRMGGTVVGSGWARDRPLGWRFACWRVMRDGALLPCGGIGC